MTYFKCHKQRWGDCSCEDECYKGFDIDHEFQNANPTLMKELNKNKNGKK